LSPTDESSLYLKFQASLPWKGPKTCASRRTNPRTPTDDEILEAMRAGPTFVESNAALVREAARLLGELALPLASELPRDGFTL